VAGLAELRAMLPIRIRLWSGGAGSARLRTPINGVELLSALASVSDTVNEWRDLNAGSGGDSV